MNLVISADVEKNKVSLFEPTLTMLEYAAIYKKAYSCVKNASDEAARNRIFKILVKEAIERKKGNK